MNEKQKKKIKIEFDGKIKIEFDGNYVHLITSNVGEYGKNIGIRAASETRLLNPSTVFTLE